MSKLAADDEACPHCGTTDGVQAKSAPSTVQAWTCAACGLGWATTVVNPALSIALSIVGLLPTPALRTAAFLAVLGTEVTLKHTTPTEPRR
ncbi:MAG: hypothetical protein ACRDRR_12485 [Pseudonocardiaceae bacterium]